MKTFSFKYIVILFLSLSAYARAESPINTVCPPANEPSQEQFQSLLAFSTQLASGKARLNLAEDCPKHSDQQKVNPYRVALEVASKQKKHSDLGLALSEQSSSSLSLEEKGKQHSEWLRIIKVACQDQLSCVKQTLHAIPNLNVAESPIFCTFTRMADYSVQMFYQQNPKPSYPVACLGHSSLTAGEGFSPMQDWFEAYKRLGK